MPIPVIDYDAHPAYRGFAGQASRERMARLRAAHAGVRQELEHRLGERLERLPVSEDASPVAQAFGQQGVVAFALDPGSNRPLFRYLDGAVERVKRSGDASYQVAVDPALVDGGAGPLGGVCLELLRAFDLLELARHQLGTDALYVKASVRYSTPENQSFQRDVIPDHPDPKTVGLHFDVPLNSVKLTVFLSEVEDLETGAFGYIPGSHLNGREDILNRSATHLLCAEDWVDQHADLMALPNTLRQRATFGGDIVPGSAMEEMVLASERVIAGPPGRCILFDTLGAHRGGMMRRGSRRVFQIGIFDAGWGSRNAAATP